MDGLTSLAGNSFGNSVFERFVAPYLREDKIIVEFPEYVRNVAIGFVQGFISQLGVEEFKKHIEVRGNPVFVSKFYERLE